MHRVITLVASAVVMGAAVLWLRHRLTWSARAGALWWIYLIGVVQITVGTPRRVSTAFCRSNADLDRWRLRPLGSLRDEWAVDPISAQTVAAVAQLGANVVLFVPLGLLVASAARRGPVATAAAVGLALSCAIEVAQRTGTFWLYPCPHRTADVDDLWCNALGATVGGLVAWARRRHRLL